MKLILRIVVVSVILSGVISCASPNMKHSISSDKVIKASPDKALVNFIRPQKIGYAVNAAVYDGDKFIGIMPYGQKLSYEAMPGEHTFMVISEAADFMKADLRAGKTYYAMVTPRMGVWRARFSLDPVSRDELQNANVKSWIESAKPIKNADSAYAWAKENHASVQEKKAAYFPKWKEKPDSQKPSLKAEDGQ
jgi:hypothetical protein